MIFKMCDDTIFNVQNLWLIAKYDVEPYEELVNNDVKSEVPDPYSYEKFDAYDDVVDWTQKCNFDESQLDDEFVGTEVIPEEAYRAE